MKLLALPLLLGALMMPSCSTISNLQRDVNTMSEAQYEGLKTKVGSITAITSSRLAKDWDVAKRAKALGVITKAREIINSNLTEGIEGLDVVGVIRALADLYGEKMGLDEQARRDVKDAALLIDALVGPIKLDIDGKLGEREKGLVLALLDGLQYGIR